MRGRPKLVTFDVTNTLLRLREKPGLKYSRSAAAFGVHVDGTVLDASFRSQWTQLNEEHPNYGVSTGIKNSDTWWRTLIDRTFTNAGHPLRSDSQLEPLSRTLIADYRSAHCWELCPGAGKVLGALSRDPGIAVGVISNFDDTLEDLLKDTGLWSQLEFVVSSYRVRCSKPESGIFKMALSKCPGVTADQAVHVGDDLRRDYFGAKCAGWRAILLSRDGLVDDGRKERTVCRTVEDAYDIILNAYR